MFNFLRKIGKSNKLDNFQDVHSGEGFKIVKANKKIPIGTLKSEVVGFNAQQITKVINDNKEILKKHTTYYLSGNFIIALIPKKTEKELAMEFVEPNKKFFDKGVVFLTLN